METNEGDIYVINIPNLNNKRRKLVPKEWKETNVISQDIAFYSEGMSYFSYSIV